MFIRLEATSGVPVTRPIADQIRAHCAAGTLAPGDRLPSVRQLAAQVPVNVNTVLRAYERLTAEGLLERRHGDGTYVAGHLPKGGAKAQAALLADEAARLAHRAADLGVSADDLRALVDQAIARVARDRAKREQS